MKMMLGGKENEVLMQLELLYYPYICKRMHGKEDSRVGEEASKGMQVQKLKEYQDRPVGPVPGPVGSCWCTFKPKKGVGHQSEPQSGDYI